MHRARRQPAGPDLKTENFEITEERGVKQGPHQLPAHGPAGFHRHRGGYSGRCRRSAHRVNKSTLDLVLASNPQDEALW